MKTLYIVRHAKSSWDVPKLGDHERPLLEKGIKRTQKIIEHLRKRNARPDVICSSSAMRARETANIIANGLNLAPEHLRIEPGLYNTDSEFIFNQLKSMPNTHQSVMLVGHNPAFTIFANHFLLPAIDWLPTSAVVGVDFETDDWDAIQSASYSIRMVLFPKLLENE